MARYIDIDKTLDAMDKKNFQDIADKEIYMKTVKDQPIADVQSVIHAHWHVNGPFIYYCPKCFMCYVYQSNYCPNCGAKMDEVEG